MKNNAEEIARLLFDQQLGRLSPEEKEIVDAWLAESTENGFLAAELADPKYLAEQLNDYNAIVIPSHETIVKDTVAPMVVRSTLTRSMRKWIAYAAALIVVVSCSLLIWQRRENLFYSKDEFVQVEDLYPAGNKAFITLEDGRRLLLDEQESAIVINENKVVYADGIPLLDKAPDQLSWMTLSTPIGGTYKVTLVDGTKVWLNTASRLRYPNRFDGDERVVELSGEAYFEVSKNPQKPFRVKSGRQEIEVLGTQFNVAAYPDELLWRTTLVEGKVQIKHTASGKKQLLKPSQQAVLMQNDIVQRNVDIDTEIAWKSDRFNFDNKSVEQILKEMGRWYGFDVVYEIEKPHNYLMGDAFRTDNLRAVLRFLDNSDISYRMERNENGKQRLIISNKKEGK